MSDELKKTVLNTLAEPIVNSTKNITDKPTQNIGTTLADIWYLVFGGISQAAEKRKLKYSYALQEFEKELKEKIDKIPEDKLIEPDMQIVAPALEASKYCVEKDDLRKMFSNLISKSLNSETKQYVHPQFVNIISQLSSYDADVIKNIYERGQKVYRNISVFETDDELLKLLISISTLEHNGLIESDIHEKMLTFPWLDNGITHIIDPYKKSTYRGLSDIEEHNHILIKLTELGRLFCTACIED